MIVDYDAASCYYNQMLMGNFLLEITWGYTEGVLFQLF